MMINENIQKQHMMMHVLVLEESHFICIFDNISSLTMRNWCMKGAHAYACGTAKHTVKDISASFQNLIILLKNLKERSRDIGKKPADCKAGEGARDIGVP